MLSMRRITSRKRPTTSALAHPRSAIGMARQGHKRCVAGGNRHGYAGYEFEPLTTYAVSHVRHRVLNNDFGRWLRRDPISHDSGNASLYLALPMGSLQANDPFGLCAGGLCSRSINTCTATVTRLPTNTCPMITSGIAWWLCYRSHKVMIVVRYHFAPG